MIQDKIWLSSPHLGSQELQYVQEAFAGNWVAPLGPWVNLLEENLAKLSGVGHVAVLSSGTAAIHLALILAGVEQGDIVLCQSFTFSASANPIAYQKAIPVFIDSESATWNMCPIALEKAILHYIYLNKKPKAIIPVHLYGMPANMAQIMSIAKTYEIPLIEDAAEAVGSHIQGKACGSFGDFGVYSFNGNKIITTSGGGAIVTKTAAQKEKAIFYATQARDNAPHYQHSHIGYNYRMSNICAGIGRGQMEVLDEHVALRRQMHDFYVGVFASIEGVDVFSTPNEEYYANYWLSAITIDATKTNGITAETLRLALEAENIESRPLWKPMHLQPIFSNYPYYGNQVAETLFETGLCLPSGSNLTDKDRERISKIIKSVFG
jgi:dTDP-4-amino-4,6-dideoxygalactose transaminase